MRETQTNRNIQELIASRDWLRVTISSIGDAVITTDAQNRITFLNPVATALTGWTLEEAVDCPLDQVFTIINEQTRVSDDSPTVSVLRDGVVVGPADHTVLVGKDGTEWPIETNAAPIRNDAGEVGGVVLVFRDITQRKRSEKALRRTQIRYRTLFDSIDEGFCVIEMIFDAGGAPIDYRILEVNPAFEVQTGLSDAAGKRMLELVPDLEPYWIEMYAKVAQTGEPIRVEHEVKSLGNRCFSVYAFRLGGANSRKVACLFSDISERKLAEKKLLNSEVRYRRLFQTAKDGILILDAVSGKIIDANAFMSGLVGLEPADLLGKELYEIGMYRDIDENKEAFRELQRMGYLRHEHLPVQNQRGERAEVEFIANTYSEDDKRVAQCNVRDISQRVNMEKQIMRQAETLANESRRKDEFLAMLSHELRNPLAPIRSAVHLLKLNERGSENPIQQQAREVIERQVANLTRLISDLLEISRVVSGRIRLNQQTIDLNQVLEHAIQTVRSMFDQRQQTLSLHLCKDGVWVKADATRMEEVFINLLNNAAKYTDEGGRIDVYCSHPRGQNYAEVRVRDNGIGIDEKFLPGIFDLFTQADQSLDRAQGGLGIGLNLAHRLVDLHGGRIEAKSPPEGEMRGSEFTVRLPLIPAPLQIDPVKPKESLPGLAGQRVLVVDDNVDSVTMLCGVLRHRGYVVQHAYTGTDGLKAALQWRPEIILLDIGLPGLDGYEVARRLRGSEETASAHIIAMTGYARETDITLAREAGFDAHLVKPYDFDDLEKLMVMIAAR